VRKILLASHSIATIVGGSGQKGSVPEISPARIVFNALGDGVGLRYEPLALYRRTSDGFGFCSVGFWRTSGYDLVVKAVLIAAANRAPDRGTSLLMDMISSGGALSRGPLRCLIVRSRYRPAWRKTR
jgi:hypothetical protein